MLVIVLTYYIYMYNLHFQNSLRTPGGAEPKSTRLKGATTSHRASILYLNLMISMNVCYFVRYAVPRLSHTLLYFAQSLHVTEVTCITNLSQKSFIDFESATYVWYSHVFYHV